MNLDIAKYLDRIDFDHPLSIDLDCLRALHRCHMLAVPFEALDVHRNVDIKLELGSLFKKVVEQRRGGYCYELNFLFYSLLKEIDFECSLISARVFHKEKFGPAYDHMAILVQLEELYLVDVGFGDSFIEPIRVSPGVLQVDQFKNYKVDQEGDHKFMLSESPKNVTAFVPQYSFDDILRSLSEFDDQNHFKQYSPDSHFIQKMICTLPTADGRKTILNDVFKQTKGEQTVARKIKSDADLREILNEHFGMDVDNLKLFS